jgi:imidazolonepropionase-like amidohydrolase
MFEAVASRGLLGNWTSDSVADRAFVAVADRRQLDQKWRAIVSGNPMFIKIYLEHSEAFSSRHNDPARRGAFGINPQLLPEIMRRARASNLPVSAHVTSVADYRLALQHGVTEIMHLPLERLSAADARETARRKVTVVTTTMGHRALPNAEIDETYRHNLRLLYNAGALLVLGTDNVDLTVIDEMMNVRRLQVMSDTALLRMAVMNTPRAIFPMRAIGALRPAAEASFIALEGNPLIDFTNVRHIRLRVKNGNIVTIQ